MYKLKDEITVGSCYRHEIKPVIHKDKVYLVEKIIHTERRGRERETWCVAMWEGYPSNMNS